MAQVASLTGLVETEPLAGLMYLPPNAAASEPTDIGEVSAISSAWARSGSVVDEADSMSSAGRVEAVDASRAAKANPSDELPTNARDNGEPACTALVTSTVMVVGAEVCWIVAIGVPVSAGRLFHVRPVSLQLAPASA